MNSNLKTEIKVKIHKTGRKSNWDKLEISPKFFETKVGTEQCSVPTSENRTNWETQDYILKKKLTKINESPKKSLLI